MRETTPTKFVYGVEAPSAEKYDREFDPFALQIGHLTRAWNVCQECVGVLFATIATPNRNIGLAIWHSTQSDRAQREMLKAACGAASALDEAAFPKAKPDIEWLLKELDSLSERRNNAVHAPFMVTFDGNRMVFNVEPWTSQDNPRAKKLVNKTLLDELVWYRQIAETLGDFAFRLPIALQHPEAPWPPRPILPTLSPRRKRGEHP